MRGEDVCLLHLFLDQLLSVGRSFYCRNSCWKIAHLLSFTQSIAAKETKIVGTNTLLMNSPHIDSKMQDSESHHSTITHSVAEEKKAQLQSQHRRDTGKPYAWLSFINRP